MKKGQITVFIIIGIILLLSAAIAIYFYQQKATESIKRVVAVPQEVQKVYDYVATCVDQIAKDGLIIMGTQGGYITIPTAIEKNPNSYISGDPAGISKIPMWYYEGEERTPTLEYMQRDLALYVKQNLPDCVGNFTSFQPQYEITPTSEILPVITFTDSEVIVEVKWQLDIKALDKVIKLTEFVSTFPLQLKNIWELASKTMEVENKQGWFENLTIDLMSSNEKIPMSGTEFSCGTKKWHLNSVKTEIQNMLYYNLPYVRVQNTQYPAPLENIGVYEDLKEQAQDIRDDLAAGKEPDWPESTPPDAFEMNRMMLNAGIKETNLKAGFTYLPEWQLLVNAQPNQGGILSSADMKGARKYLRFFCMNQWHFAYDLIYPIKMTIRDDQAFNGEGYNFQIAFPVIIDDNEESRLFFGLRKFVIPDTGAEFCTNFGTQQLDVRASGFVEGGVFAEELEDVNITYRCVNQECKLGKTYSDGSGAVRLSAYLPQGCANPTIIATKEGYLQGQAIATGKDVEILLTKLQHMNYIIRVHPYREVADKENPAIVKESKWYPTPAYTRFTKTMHATISITLRNGALDQYKLYPANTTAAKGEGTYELAGAEMKNELDLVWGEAQYDVDILLFKGNTPVGGYHAENLTISYEEIAGKSNAVFNVIEYQPLPTTSEQQAGMFLFLYERGLGPEGQPYEEALRPTFT